MNYYAIMQNSRYLAGPLKGLVTKGGLSFSRDPLKGLQANFNWGVGLTAEERKILASPVQAATGGSLPVVESLVELYVLGQALAEGPKLFRPTAAECEALEEIEVTVPVSDYAQPFDTFSVEFPPGYMQARAVEGLDLDGRSAHYRPVAATVRHEKALGVLLLVVYTDHASGLVLVGILGTTPDTLLEADINRRLANSGASLPAEVVLQQRCSRIALNACLLLMQGGFREAGHACRAEYIERLRRRNSRADQENLALIPEVYTFAQDVDVRRAVGPAEAAEFSPTGRQVRPHYRRSHWRMQRHGAGLALVKRLLIPHTLVRRDRFRGDPGDTVYTAR
jgi:hypothetical protein